MFFNSWEDIGRLLLVGTLAYIGLICLLRISGKRTLAKMNAFDLVVTVSLGSILSSAVLSKDVSLAESLTAFALMIGLQYIVAWSSVRIAAVRNLVKSEPTLLCYQGQILSAALLSQRVAAEEVRAAIRGQGTARVEDVEAVILETDGSFSVLPRTSAPATAAIPDLKRYPLNE